MRQYAKAFVAVGGAAVTAALQLGLTGTAQQILTVAAAAITVASVYLVPNVRPVPDAVKALRAYDAKQAPPTGGSMQE